MSEILIYNTDPNANYNVNDRKGTSGDPWHHLPAPEWVEKQIDYGVNNVSGEYLIPLLKEYNKPLVGCEIGVCLGFTSEAILRNVLIEKLYAVDNYPTFIDWNGGDLNADRQKLMKEYAYKLLLPFSNKIDFVYKSSVEFANEIEDEALDFIFIDGDHSYDGCLGDFSAWWPKVKSGGLFTGHDFNLPSVNEALKDFLGDKFNEIKTGTRDVWYLYK